MIEIEKIPFTPKGDRRNKKWDYFDDAKIMQSYIKDGDTIYDCGANVFDHAIFFAINNKKSKIIAFEPVKEYFDFGKKNVAYFDVKNVVAINAALDSERGEMSISIDNEGSSLAFKHESANTEVIKVETIDYLVDNKIIPAPDFIKIDVEGFALPLIKGAIKTIEKYKPTIAIEVHPQFVGHKESVQKLNELSKLGLNVVQILGQGREYIVKHAEKKVFWEKGLRKIALDSVWELRMKYEKAETKLERSKLVREYKDLITKTKPSFSNRLLWSRLYCFFSFKRLKK